MAKAKISNRYHYESIAVQTPGKPSRTMRLRVYDTDTTPRKVTFNTQRAHTTPRTVKLEVRRG